ncbi:RtcB family protein, partial [Candidatus Marithioploca araucensis]|nr:RtcB family protein [Candidatus Marithioploca araucensis]
MPIQMFLNTGKVPVKIYTNDVASHTIDQLKLIAELPFIHSHVAAMPDVHKGIGATIGSVIPTKGAIIPAAVGVDIGCGMNATRLSINASQLPDNLKQVRLAIEEAVPVGFSKHKSILAKNSTIKALNTVLEEQIFTKHPAVMKMIKKPYQTWTQQLGTLGGGNHFIEICLDENKEVWVMLHSGSRGIGNVIGRYFIKLAKKDMEKHIAQLPHRDLAYFTEGAKHFDDYVEAVHWAQEYASFNRREMMRLIIEALRKPLPPFDVTKEAISCHHNYVAIEDHFGSQVFLTRKGAIRAGEGELGIIPGSMGVKSYIVRGKGNPESFCSCSHGAGRQMSRTEAKRRFNTNDMETQTQGVECRKDRGVIDEIPGAYKDIDKVM